MKFRKNSRKDHKELKKQKRHAQSVKYLRWQKSARSEPSGKIQKSRTNMGGINGQMNRIFSKLDIFKQPEENQQDRRNAREDEDVDSSDEDLGDRLERAYSGKEEKVENELKESFEDRVARLKRDNEEEEKEITRLEKMLYLNKRKNNNMPKSFVEEGLDFILEVVDKKYKKKYNDDLELLDEAEGELKNAFMNKDADGGEENSDDGLDDDEDEDEDEDDEVTQENKKRRLIRFADQQEEGEASNDDTGSDLDEECEDDDAELEDESENSDEDEEMENSGDNDDDEEIEDSGDDDDEADVMARLKAIKRSKNSLSCESVSKRKRTEVVEDEKSNIGGNEVSEGDSEDEDSDINGDEDSDGNLEDEDSDVNGDEDSDGDLEDEDSDINDDEDGNELDGDDSGSDVKQEADDFIRKKTNIGPDGSYEDIYGRKRNAAGDVVSSDTQKYVPPAKRLALSNNMQLEKLQKQVKGLLNRLSETNLRFVAQQMTELYAKHSKNNITSTLSVAINDAVFGTSATPERLILEPTLLCALLHANIGQEVGAQILEDVIDRLKSLLETGNQGKKMENVLQFLCYLFLFRVVSHGLIYDILKKFDPADERDVDYIMAILKTCGFALRKNDPLALKELIVSMQAKCKASSSNRHRFMLDTLMALKNNNISKISNCDPSASERAFKSLRTCLNKGAVLQEINVSLEDLYDARVRGKWWLVGSAWANENSSKSKAKDSNDSKLAVGEEFGSKILELAAKAGMNTDIRRAIFCIIMSAQDYIDASERILRLNLTHVQQREFCYVLLLCITKEKQFNPYYAHLALFFCNKNKKIFSMTLQCAIWDFIKSIDSYTEPKVKHLASFTSLLVSKKGLPLAVLKNIEFIDLANDKVITFLRCFLLDILNSLREEEITSIFSKVALAGPKLGLLKEGLLVFFKKFLMKNAKFLHGLNPAEIRDKLRVAEEALSIQNEKSDFDLFE